MRKAGQSREARQRLLHSAVTVFPTAEYKGVLEAEASSTPVTFSKVSVPVQNWALVAERWRRRRRRRWRR
jgi:hypothetical protein